jgi:tetratricopeptide (TPR) repeat protein
MTPGRALTGRAATRWILLVLLGAALLASACAKRIRPPIPESEDYLFPTPAAGELSGNEATTLRRAWEDVMAGDVASARRRLQRLRRQGPGRPSVETVLAYAELRAGRAEDAERGFAAALVRAPLFTPALVGAGSTAARRGDLDAALAYYRLAASASPSDPIVRKRLGDLKLQLTERHMARAQSAIEASDLAAAIDEYRRALEAAPEVAGIRLDLADLLQKAGDSSAAVSVLASDPSGERQVKLRLAAVLVDSSQFEQALAVYRELLARDPADEAARAGEAVARERLETSVMPEEYRQIPNATQLTRADLAALLVVRVKALRRVAPGDPQVAVDISGSWAREQILSALTLAVMDVYPNHTFQPGAIVRRVDLARAAGRILDRLGWPRAAAPAPVDMPRSHLDYDAVQHVLGAGLMGLTSAGAFEPWRPVSGPEALEVVDALARLVGP